MGASIALLVTAGTIPLARHVALLVLTENYLADLRMALMSPPQPRSKRIAVVVINDDSLARYPYRSPLDRSLIANLIVELERRSVVAIGVNVLFDRATEPAKDRQLYELLRKTKVPVVLSRMSGSAGYSHTQVEYSKAYLNNLRSGLSVSYRDPVDNTIRASLLKTVEGTVIQRGFAATLAEVLGAVIPDQERLVIDFRPGPDLKTPAFPVYPAHEVAALPESALANRVVLIGSDLDDDGGFKTPLSVLKSGTPRNLSGVEIEAHVLSQIIENRSLQVVSKDQGILLTLLFAVLGCLHPLIHIRLWSKLVLSLLFVPVTWTAAFLVYTGQGLILPIVSPTLAFVMTFIMSSFWQWRSDIRERDRIHHAFGQYLAPEIVEKIMLGADELELSGEVREVRFLFTDLEGFTLLTESTSPRIMVGLVNSYLEEACEIVIEHGGVIDKIVGDALHVMFNAPLLQADHAQRAVVCALALDKWSTGFRERMRKQDLDLGVTRIGVNTGSCIVGNFGGKKRFDYTAHGDAINATGRLEAVNKRLGTTICISDSTVRQCHDIHFRPIANLVLPGKTQGILAYLPVTDEEHDLELSTRYELAYQSLRKESACAIDLFVELAGQYPEDILIKLHLNRIESGETGDTLFIRRK